MENLLKMPRKDLSLKEKINILDQIRKHPFKTPCRQLAQLTGIGKTTIAKLIKEEKDLRSQFSTGDANHPKRRREGKDPVVENALSDWFSMVSNRGVRITGPLLKEKSQELALKLGHENFKATDGWLSRWKTRKEIQFKKAHGEKGSADTVSAETWKQSTLAEVLDNFCADDIYNADETGLYYRATPDGSLCYKRTALLGSKKAMDRITVLCCANMSGSDKKPLVVVGKSSKPRCFKGISMKNLGVDYYANKNAWMTSAIFTDWLQKWDKQLKRRILLIVDNCRAHPFIHLKNIRIEFLPPNTTSILQPMDMGIIKVLKGMYRSKLVKFVLQKIEENVLDLSSSAPEITKKINLLNAIQFAADSWTGITDTTIKNCFSHAGFHHSINTDETTSHTVINEHVEGPDVQNLEEFLNIDNDVLCYDENEEDIERDLIKKYSEQEEDSDSDEEVEVVSTAEARKSLEVLRCYFLQHDNSPMNCVKSCEQFLQTQSIKNYQQQKITNFFM